MGIVSTNWARHWDLFWLRLPIVFVTFLTAGLVFLLARRITGGQEGGYLAALTFLGFRSTFQYGRPFLTNMPETLFVFLPIFLLLYFRRRIEDWGRRFWLVVGVLLGIACLFKSFVLVVPVGVALAWIFLSERDWDVATFLRRDVSNIGLALLVALLAFALWPLLDPDPSSVIRNFVLGENVGKLAGQGYFQGLFTGPYSVYRIWLAPLASAGFFALPLLYVAFGVWCRRDNLGFEEKALWIVTLSFLIVYTFPSQRQENYLLPIMPGMAVLLATSWIKIPRRWFYVFLFPAVVALLVLFGLMFEIDGRVFSGSGYTWWQIGVPAVCLMVCVASLLRNRLAPFTFHFIGFLLFISLTCLLAPFDGPAGRFDTKRVVLVKDKTVYVPEGFVSKHERHRFLLPGARIEGYDPTDMGELDRLLRSRRYVVVHRPLGETIAGPYRTIARRLDLKSRQSREEILRILFQRDLDPFIRQELVVRRRTAARERGSPSKPF
jgi:4-amino-4-deoxy-L-arabinose transferase-like glycosyltransferase